MASRKLHDDDRVWTRHGVGARKLEPESVGELPER